MTRKDYRAIAAALAEVRAGWADAGSPDLHRAHHEIARELARTLARDTPRFDALRFRRAAGVPDDDSSIAWDGP